VGVRTLFKRGTIIDGKYVPSPAGVSDLEMIRFTYKGAKYSVSASRGNPLRPYRKKPTIIHVPMSDVRQEGEYIFLQDYTASQHFFDMPPVRDLKHTFKQGEKVFIRKGGDFSMTEYLVTTVKGKTFRIPSNLIEPVYSTEEEVAAQKSNQNAFIIIGIGALAFLTIITLSR